MKTKTPGEILEELISSKLETGKSDAKLQEEFENSTREFFESRGCHVTFEKPKSKDDLP